LLEEANITSRTTFSEFTQKYGRDERFKNIEKMRERESMFNEYLSQVKKREREEKSAQREKIRQDFIDLLKEQKDLHRHSSWTEVKERIRDDYRYKAVDSSSFREEIFRRYISDLKKKEASGDHKDSEDERDIKEKEKKDRIEASLRERYKAVERELQPRLKELDKEREQHRHAEAVEQFTVLLTDLIKNPNISWHEAKKQLKKDHRYDMVVSLDREEKRKLFESHREALIKKKRTKFRELLRETKEITLSTRWKEAQKLIKNDPRYKKFSTDDNECKQEYLAYLEDRLNEAKEEFKELLKETKIITWKSKKMIEESADQHLQDIIAVLQNDKRYLVLECDVDARRQILMDYIEEIHRKGPPPPPTASEPNRRTKL